tara:strand:+ start:474 stop:695 length:222 start_codon:yes stop_codon:yes gene_type:complete
MNPGDIVRYRIFPHEELHFSGMTGLVLSKPYVQKDQYGELVSVDVMWSEERSSSWGGLNITWDYIDELEVVEK